MRVKGINTMRKLIAIVALASLLALAGCGQGRTSSSASASSGYAVSSSASSEVAELSIESTGQSGVADAQSSTEGMSNSAADRDVDADNAEDAEGADTFVVHVGDAQLTVTLANTDAARALAEHLRAGPFTVNLHAYGGFEKVGALPWSLPSNDEQIITSPGDVMLYQGDQITIFTDSNSWAYTPLGRIEGATSDSLLEVFGNGDVDAVLSLP